MSKGLVLVAEDSQVVRRLLRLQLEGGGYAVLEAADGRTALATAGAERPDVVLLDVEMPGLDGFAVLEGLRDDPELAPTPVVFITGRTDPADVVRGLEAGAYDYLRKPFESIEVLARVNAAMRTKHLQDELRRLNAELERQAMTDALTGLHNRRFLDGQLERLTSRSARHGRELALLLLDLDRFKAINDAHGHPAGDAVLAEVARRLRKRLRREDVPGRWGGEEFVVLAPDIGPRGAAALAQALRDAVAAAPVEAGGARLRVTASVGWATWQGAGDGPAEIVARADRALYEAKASGRDAVRGG